MRNRTKKGNNLASLPYYERLQLQKQEEINRERVEAAQLVCKIATVALYHVFGFGLTRCARFCNEVAQLSNDFYSDKEIGALQLDRELERIGFEIRDGKIMMYEDEDGTPLKPEKALALAKERAEANAKNDG